VDLLEAYSERRCQACLADPQYLASRPDAGAYRNRIGFFVSGGQNPSLRDGLRTQHYTCPERQDNRQTDISLDGGMAGPVLRLSSAGGLVPSRFSSLRRWGRRGSTCLPIPLCKTSGTPRRRGRALAPKIKGVPVLSALRCAIVRCPRGDGQCSTPPRSLRAIATELP
jgi:hypothetical protein